MSAEELGLGSDHLHDFTKPSTIVQFLGGSTFNMQAPLLS